MMEQTVKEISEATGISRFTLAQVAKRGDFKEAVRLLGHTYVIETEHPQFKQWLERHWQQPRVKGKQSHETL